MVMELVFCFFLLGLDKKGTLSKCQLGKKNVKLKRSGFGAH